MKTSVLFTIMLALFSSVSLSQITLTSAQFPNVNENTNYFVEANNYPVTNAGENQTWDLSLVNGQSAIVYYPAASTGADADIFTEATMIELSGAYSSYIKESADKAEIIGLNVNGQLRADYSDPLEYFRFPMNYGDTYSDDFFADFIVFDTKETGIDYGTYDVEYDAYGDLILPYGTIENVARLKTVSNLTEIFQDDTINVVTTNYLWLASDFSNLIATYRESVFNGATTYSVTYVSQSDYYSIEEQERQKFAVYPNPTQDMLYFTGTYAADECKIYSLTGQLLIDEELNSLQSVSTSDLPTGVYLLELTSGGVLSTHRIVKE